MTSEEQFKLFHGFGHDLGTLMFINNLLESATILECFQCQEPSKKCS